MRSFRQAVENGLLPWFHRHKRILPWRTRRTPYRVWISELMLQQTQVQTVGPYYQRWMKRFPSLRSLADAPLQDVLKQWQGLGYYTRARNAHRAARHIQSEHGGRFPRDYEGLLALPGVGPYTAAAIGSLAMELDVAVVDGNVTRVAARLLALDEDVASAAAKATIQDFADTLLIPGRAGDLNEALMELGATVCLPRAPACASCPFTRVCRARRSGEPTRFPVKARARAVPHKHVGAGLVVNRHGELLIARRREDAMLGGMWEFPGGVREPGESNEACIARELHEELGIRVVVGRHFLTVRHAFSHFTMDLHAHWAKIRTGRPRAIACSDYAWVGLDGLRTYPFPRADVRIIESLEASGIER